LQRLTKTDVTFDQARRRLSASPPSVREPISPLDRLAGPTREPGHRKVRAVGPSLCRATNYHSETSREYSAAGLDLNCTVRIAPRPNSQYRVRGFVAAEDNLDRPINPQVQSGMLTLFLSTIHRLGNGIQIRTTSTLTHAVLHCVYALQDHPKVTQRMAFPPKLLPSLRIPLKTRLNSDTQPAESSDYHKCHQWLIFHRGITWYTTCHARPISVLLCRASSVLHTRSELSILRAASKA
jgi:hypothetical protein